LADDGRAFQEQLVVVRNRGFERGFAFNKPRVFLFQLLDPVLQPGRARNAWLAFTLALDDFYYITTANPVNGD
jgi:hypothetical protein